MSRSSHVAFLVLLAIFIAGVSCRNVWGQADNLERPEDLLSKPTGKGVPIATITLHALKSKIDRGERVFLVEACERQQFRRCHLAGSLALQQRDVRKRAPHKLPDKSGEIVVFGATTADSECDQLARELVAMGYTDVRIFPGGVKAWLGSGYPTAGSRPTEP